MIQNDVMIYDTSKDMPTKAQSSNLNEELGMVHFVFSDKTGTLTQNVMEFKKFSAGNISYGSSNPQMNPEIVKQLNLSNVNFDDPIVYKHLNDPEQENFVYLCRMLEILAICHTVVVEKKNGKNVYNAASPDELALVEGAKYLGLSFNGRDEDDNVIVESTITGESQRF